MNKGIKIIAIISGIITIITPLAISLFWRLYVEELNRVSTAIPEGKCTPYDLRILTNDEEITVKWKTQDVCSGYLVIGDVANISLMDGKKLLTSSGEVPVTEFSVLYYSSATERKYAYIVSENKKFGVDGKAFLLK